MPDALDIASILPLSLLCCFWWRRARAWRDRADEYRARYVEAVVRECERYEVMP